jgi:phospholipase/carboxylesterase
MQLNKLLLECIVREPTVAQTKPPLLVLLHGVGGNETNLFKYADMVPPEYVVVAARAPFVKTIGSYAWFSVNFAMGKPIINPEEAEQSRIMLMKFINQLIEKYNADSNNIYLVGFSQGAIMCYSVALTNPGRIKGFAALSGRILPEIKPLVIPSETLSKLKVLISHGEEDNKLPVRYARDAKEYIESLHIPLTYIEWPDTGHLVNHDIMTKVVEWME